MKVGDLLSSRPSRANGFKGTPDLWLVRSWRERERERDMSFIGRCSVWTVVGLHEQTYAFRHELWVQLAGVRADGTPVAGWILGPLTHLHPLLEDGT